MLLSEISEKDKSWDQEKLNNVQMVNIFAQSTNSKLREWAVRAQQCCKKLDFAETKTGVNVETGEVSTHLKLVKADFCHVRTCPICMKRKTLFHLKTLASKWQNIIQSLNYPENRLRTIFMTLTIKNCDVHETRETIRRMNEAWNRLVGLDCFKIVKGWIRATEVTNEVERIGRRKVPTMRSHPHFHCVLLVPESYFSGGVYIKKMDWARIWGRCLKVDYTPIVDIRCGYAKKAIKANGVLANTFFEALKYSIKSSDMLKNPEWGCEVALQIHALKFLTSGGCFKGVFKKDKNITNDDLIGNSDIKEEVINVISFLFDGRHYVLDKVKSKDEVESKDNVEKKTIPKQKIETPNSLEEARSRVRAMVKEQAEEFGKIIDYGDDY